jgi:1-deoxy-D-xylulose-5-phosphate reductoisomerase
MAKLLCLTASALALSPARCVVAGRHQHTVRMGLDPAAPVLTAADLRYALDRALDQGFQRKHVALLGSTGSIGTQSLDIAREYPDYFEIVSLSAGSNVELLAKQVAEFMPKVVGLADASKETELRDRIRALGAPMPQIVSGPEGQIAVATAPGADTVVTGVVGVAGLLPTIEAIKLGRTIALANKETIIAGGPVACCAPLATALAARAPHPARALPRLGGCCSD